MTKSNLGEGRDSHSSPVMLHHWGKPGQEFKTRTWRQELIQRNATYWFASHGLINFCSYTPQEHLSGMTLPTAILALPHKSLIKMSPQTGQSDVDSFSTKVPSSQMKLTGVKFGRKKKEN